MAGRISGITIEINGDTTKLQSALKGVDQTLKTTQRNLKDINNLLKFNPGNVELLTQKQKNLKTAIEQTKNRLKELKEAQSGVEKGTAEWDNLQREIIATEQELKKLQSEYRSFGSVAKQAVQAAAQKTKELSEKLERVGSNLTRKVTAPIVAGFTVAGKAASDYEENMNKLDVAFGKSAKKVKEFTDNAIKGFGLSKVGASEAASSFGALAKGVGQTEENAAEMAITLTGLSADLASYFNTGTDESAKALEAIFTGESEALKKFGVVMTETNLKQFAADTGLVYSEMTQAEKVQLRYNYVLAKTADAQGDYARTSEGTANSVKTAKAALEDLATAIGEHLLPLITPLIQKITSIIQKFNKLSPETQKLITKVLLLVAALGPAILIGSKILSLVSLLMTGISFLLTPMGLIVVAIAAVVAAGVLLYKNWDKIKDMTKKLGKAIKRSWEDMKKSVVKAATDLKTKVVNTWNQLKTNVTTIWNNIKTTITTVVNNIKTAITTKWNNIRTTVVNTVNSLKTSVTTAWNNLKTSVSNTVSSLQTSVANAWSNMKSTVSNAVSNMQSAATSAFSSIRSSASSIWESIRSTIASKITSAKDTVSNMIDKIKSLFNFNWKLPTLKLPHLNVWYSDADSAFLKFFGVSRIPHVSVSWYKKAMENPMMFTSPTVLATPNGLKGFGDGHGAEIVLGLNKLRELVGTSGNVTINVYAQPGMNVNQLADAIQDRFVALNKQRSLAYA